MANDNEPSRKRPRLEEDTLPETVFRDQNYYFSDGSCVLRIQNTLFNGETPPKHLTTQLIYHSESFSTDSDRVRRFDRLLQVHRTMMSADGSTFGGMFLMPIGDGQHLEGTEQNPVILTGDSVEEFRNFLWALYSLYVHQLLAEICSSNPPQTPRAYLRVQS
jgi:hypothetical protein